MRHCAEHGEDRVEGRVLSLDYTYIFHKIYVMGKLTLYVDDELIAAAKDEAALRSTSVSKLVSDFLRVISTERDGGLPQDLPPITASLVGSLRGASSEKSDYIDYLEQKHS